MSRIKHLFNQALELETAEREIFLADACGDDVHLRKEVESLLDSYHRVEDFLQTPATGVSVSEVLAQALESEESAIGKIVGAYRIIGEIGRGGMGAVYLATRTDGQFQKKVAVKLLRRGTQTEAAIRRFHNERQILADLEHPFIARLIDGGVTENGLPYFVMEYVEGSRIDRFCDDRNLSVDERLELFRQVCEAVQFAHQNSIVHRDIKPSNILVTKDGTPKLLDFGIAKVSRSNQFINKTDTTATVFRVMTPDYASPEQMRGDRITEATDIYSLGVLLYELLTGHRPYQLKGKSPYEIVRAICEEEPIRPSLVENNQTTGTNAKAANAAKQKNKSLKGDLEDIVLKALRKEPAHRYKSVAEFSEDIRRYKSGLPITARRDKIFYRGAKFFKRNQTAAISALAVAFAFLLIGFSLSLFVERVDNKELTEAGVPANDEEDLALEKQKGGTNNEEARNLYLKAQSLWNQRTLLSLRQAAELFQQATEKDAEFALAYSGLSNSYFLLSVWGSIPPKEAFPKAKAASLKAIDLAPEMAEGHLSLAMVHWLYEYDWNSADREFKRAIELNPLYVRAPHWYGLFLAEMGRFDEAIASEKRALEIEPHSLPVNADLARVLYYARRYDESLTQYRKTIAMNPSYTAFYNELQEFYAVTEMINEWYDIAEKLDIFNRPALREAFQQGGIKAYWRKVTELTHKDKVIFYYDYYFRAVTYAQLGENDLAIEFLNKAMEARCHQMAQLKVNPTLDNLRNDSRFKELVERMNFSNQ